MLKKFKEFTNENYYEVDYSNIPNNILEHWLYHYNLWCYENNQKPEYFDVEELSDNKSAISRVYYHANIYAKKHGFKLDGNEYMDTDIENDENENNGVGIDISDDLKNNFRSWEIDCDDEDSANQLINILQSRHPKLSDDKIKEIAYNWTGYKPETEDEPLSEAYVNNEKTKQVREDLKKEFPQFKFSVKKRHHSTVDVAILEGPMPLTDKPNGYEVINVYWIEENYKNKPEIKDILLKMLKIINKGNFDESDIMTDYFHVGFYVKFSIGEYDRPYIVTNPIKKTSITTKKESEPTETDELPRRYFPDPLSEKKIVYKFNEFKKIHEDKLEDIAYNGERFEIKIIKASQNESWYKNLIGDIFVATKQKNEYKIIPEKYLNKLYPSYNKIKDISGVHYILEEDCQVIKKL